MKLAFFSIPVQSPTGASGELNRFLESHVILGMERQFVQDGQNSLWAVCGSRLMRKLSGWFFNFLSDIRKAAK